MQADEVQNANEPIAAQIDLSGQTLKRSKERLISLNSFQATLDACPQCHIMFETASNDGFPPPGQTKATCPISENDT